MKMWSTREYFTQKKCRNFCKPKTRTQKATPYKFYVVLAGHDRVKNTDISRCATYKFKLKAPSLQKSLKNEKTSKNMDFIQEPIDEIRNQTINSWNYRGWFEKFRAPTKKFLLEFQNIITLYCLKFSEENFHPQSSSRDKKDSFENPSQKVLLEGRRIFQVTFFSRQNFPQFFSLDT